MVTQPRVQLHTLALLLLVVHLGQPVCVEVPSATEAVLGKSMLLTCIFCMKREELKPKTHVNWYYKPTNDIPTVHIYNYEKRMLSPQAGQFKGRLTWKGSYDFQEVSIQIHNVTFNDSGIYECHVTREFKDFIPPSNFMKNITLKVKEKALSSVVSEGINSNQLLCYLLRGVMYSASWMLGLLDVSHSIIDRIYNTTCIFGAT
ncbi:sodium channel subunit beta-3 isoform X3 [Hippoglossus stenolepis]|uniref:sodium channel subunit beta-3 isoform X3 n=1 Tax=Hippoglossus stenolepis TaxID=195615 RepID=UPI00159C8E89|nr:sodium channel subunit beta-3 isoform X3 [Hippoglossus stenolepis]